MNIEFIKWLTGYTKDYEFIMKNEESYQLGNIQDKVLSSIPPRMEPYIIAYNLLLYCLTDTLSYRFKRELYPLLLQRAIEGINDTTNTEITQAMEYISVEFILYDPEEFWFCNFNSVDQAKEAALNYLWKKTNG